MKILITGIGITGKSTFRQYLNNLLKSLGLKVIALDLDYDRDKIPDTYFNMANYIFEDVHGPTQQAIIPLQEYDLVCYLYPSWLTHLRFWFSRMTIWFKLGQFAWDADKGTKGEWLGTGQPYDLKNIVPILQDFWQHFKIRSRTIKNDLSVIKKSKIPIIIIIPIKKRGKIYFQFKQGVSLK